MHKEFRALLENATGKSEFVIAVNIDIRGFSSFSRSVDSFESAMFLKKVYRKLIDEYFPNASFFKPTGDGLLVIIPYTEENPKEDVTNTVRACLSILRDFGSFCVNDPMIYFGVPEKVGIGLSKGAACCLFSEGKKLDYSGKAINLASRLMDFARPSGIVFDANFGIQLLPDELKGLFSKDGVYIRGISEKEPIGIYYTRGFTYIHPSSKQPLQKVRFKVQKDTKTLKEIKVRGPGFAYPLSSEPADPDKIEVGVIRPAVEKGRRVRDVITRTLFEKFHYFLEAGKPKIVVDFGSLATELEQEGIKDNWKIRIEIRYPKK